jgi:hypothetical protein
MAVVNGNSGNNNLLGTAQADTLRGFAGSDVLNGRGGNDTSVGGGNADTFLFIGDEFGVDRIVDFHHGQGDKIRIVDVERGSNDIESFNELDTNHNGRLDAGDVFIDLISGDLRITLNPRDGDDPPAVIFVNDNSFLRRSDVVVVHHDDDGGHGGSDDHGGHGGSGGGGHDDIGAAGIFIA